MKKIEVEKKLWEDIFFCVFERAKYIRLMTSVDDDFLKEYIKIVSVLKRILKMELENDTLNIDQNKMVYNDLLEHYEECKKTLKQT